MEEMTTCPHRKIASLPHDLYFCDRYEDDVYCYEKNCPKLGNLFKPYYQKYRERKTTQMEFQWTR